MNFQPLISIIIPTYNRRYFVSEAIDSVLYQDYGSVEILVVDDGSTDGTSQYIPKKYGEKIRFIYQDNAEKSKARNNGIIQAKGQLISLLDSDDILLPEALKNMVETFNKNPQAEVVYGVYLENQKTRKLKYSKPKNYPNGFILPYYLEDQFIHNNTFMISKDLFLKIGLYNEGLTNHEDFELLIRLMSQLKFYYCGGYVSELRKSDNSARNNYEKILKQGIKAIECLYNTPETIPSLKEWKGKLYAEEYLILAAAAYHSGQSSLFLRYYKKAISYQISSLWKKRFLRRFLISLVK